MAGDYPDLLEPARHRDAAGRGHEPWARRLVLALLLAVMALGLAGVFGQRAVTTRAAGPGADLEVTGPTRVRGGLLVQQRITARAREAIARPRLVLASGWLDGLQVNTLEPAPVAEASRGGRLVLSYPRLDAGATLTVYIQHQVDPTHVGRTDQGVELDDGAVRLAAVRRTLTTFP